MARHNATDATDPFLEVLQLPPFEILFSIQDITLYGKNHRKQQ